MSNRRAKKIRKILRKKGIAIDSGSVLTRGIPFIAPDGRRQYRATKKMNAPSLGQRRVEEKMRFGK